MIVTKIQRFSLHDGPGIRTTIFFKGCPLRCAWCHNPETWRWEPESFHDQDHCRLCSQCSTLDYCPLDYKGTVGEGYSNQQLVDLVLKDRDFYGNTGGGVTLSGGEVLSQPIESLHQLVQDFKSKGISIALDTSGYGELSAIKTLLPYLSLILFDIKMIDNQLHAQLVGTDNTLILQNLKWLLDHKPEHLKLHLRLPLLQPFHTSESYLADLLSWLDTHDKNHGIDQIDLLPYHSMGQQKGVHLLDPIKLEVYSAPTTEMMQVIENALQQRGYLVTVGGTLGGTL